jgi:sugar lactone lactonase YvrE
MKFRLKLSTLCLGVFLASPVAPAVTFQIADAVEFNKIINTNAPLTTNATINTWLEGPVWIPSGGFLVFCDQNNNRLKKLVPPNTVTDFLVPPANTLYNGTILDAQEQLVAAAAGTSGLSVAMITNGVATTLVSTCNGLKFYSPNDVAVVRRHDPGSPIPVTTRHARRRRSRDSKRLLRLSIQSHQRQCHLQPSSRADSSGRTAFAFTG